MSTLPLQAFCSNRSERQPIERIDVAGGDWLEEQIVRLIPEDRDGAAISASPNMRRDPLQYLAFRVLSPRSIEALTKSVSGGSRSFTRRLVNPRLNAEWGFFTDAVLYIDRPDRRALVRSSNSIRKGSRPAEGVSMVLRSNLIAEQAAEYATHFRGAQAFFTRYRPYICPFEPLVAAVPPAARVLDIGAGNGLFLYLLRAHGLLREGLGIDIGADEISAGDRALAALGIDNVRLVVAKDVLEWPAGTFDAVSMIDVMHHIPSQAQRLFFQRGLARVSYNGKLIYKDMCRKPTWRAWANRLHDFLRTKQWINYRAVEDVESWARSEGFQLCDSRTINIYYYGHEFRVFQREK